MVLDPTEPWASIGASTMLGGYDEVTEERERRRLEILAMLDEADASLARGRRRLAAEGHLIPE